MSVMSIRINDKKRKALKIIASVEGKTMGSLMEQLIDDFIRNNEQKYGELLVHEDLGSFMKMSESTFGEWDNEEDEIYNNL